LFGSTFCAEAEKQNEKITTKNIKKVGLND